MFFHEKKTDVNSGDIEKLKQMEENELKEAETVNKLMMTVSGISSFDVGMSYISKQLVKYAGELADLSRSNLAIIEETTASMNEVNSTVENTSNVIGRLNDNTEALSVKSDESKTTLDEVQILKDDLTAHTETMDENINRLVDLSLKIGKIVEAVQDIASQTNLLALNASIEAARAGEHGKGFAVVADEVRVLADNTKKNLSGMKEFVTEIGKAAQESKESLNISISSTNEIGVKIETVSSKITENVSNLHNIVKEVSMINKSMEQIKLSASEVNRAMESTSDDAHSLSAIADNVNDTASESSKFSGQISTIDDQLSDITESFYDIISEGKGAVTGKELTEIIDKAETAHVVWLAGLKKIVDEGKEYPLQINPKKCAFGHYYNALKVDDESINENWKKIGSLHSAFHTIGKSVLAKIDASDTAGARELYAEADELSKKLIALLEDTKTKIALQ